jgi:hypothetical protein
LALALWALATLTATAWLVASQARLRRSIQRYDRARIDGVDVIVGREFGPAVVGVVRPQIVLPSWVFGLDEADRRLVLAHEREHERGGDPALQLAGLVIAVALPWNVAVWWQLTRLRLAIEIDCDARVVARQHVHPARYGALLVRARDAAPASSASALALVQSKSTLARRVDALLGLPRHSVTRLVGSVAASAVLVGAVAVSPAPPIRRASLPSVAVGTASTAAVETPRVVAPAVARASASPGRRRTPSAVARSSRQGASDRVPEVGVPPMRITPMGVDVSTPSVAALPARRMGAAVITPRATGGFLRATASDSAVGRSRAFGRGGAVSDTVARPTSAAAVTGGVVRAVRPPGTPPAS